MRRVTLAMTLAVTMLVSLFITDLRPADAAATRLYLGGNGVPEAGMSATQPPSGPLPDYDDDDVPGRLLDRTGKGLSETHVDKYQQWEHHVDATITVQDLVIWAAAKDFEDDKTVRFTARLLDCDPGCEIVDTASAVLSDGTSWQSVSLSFNVTSHTFDEKMVLKLTVDSDSEEDMMFAYGTGQYDARLHIVYAGSPTTTTTAPTTTTTTAPTTTTTTTQTTTTTAPTTTTTSGGGQGTAEPGPFGNPATSTTSTSTTTPAGESPATTTTTTDTGQETSTTTTDDDDASVLVDGFGSGPGDIAPRMIRLADSPTDQPTAEAFEERLRPQEGLMVVFSTAAETIELYWQVAVALGGVMALLLVIGFRRVVEEDPRLTPPSRLAWLRLNRLR